MSVPLDRDGFLRRECPTCEREFKWFNSPEGQSEPPPVGGYYCPYCAVQAPPGSWFTKSQIAKAQSVMMSEIVDPEIEKLRESLSRLGAASGGLIEAKLEVSRASDAPSPQLTEADDMVRVDFECHPKEPLKVIDAWETAVHCLVCGQPNTA